LPRLWSLGGARPIPKGKTVKNLKTTVGKIANLAKAPARIVDRWTGFQIGMTELDLTETELLADLDPGWLRWREEITNTRPEASIAA
jgi:hypothetical protein